MMSFCFSFLAKELAKYVVNSEVTPEIPSVHFISEGLIGVSESGCQGSLSVGLSSVQS